MKTLQIKAVWSALSNYNFDWIRVKNSSVMSTVSFSELKKVFVRAWILNLAAQSHSYTRLYCANIRKGQNK